MRGTEVIANSMYLLSPVGAKRGLLAYNDSLKILPKLGSALYMLYVLFIFIHKELDGIVHGRGSCVKSPIMDINIVIIFFLLQLSLQLYVYNQITRIFIFHFYRADLWSPAGWGGGGSFEPPPPLPQFIRAWIM